MRDPYETSLVVATGWTFAFGLFSSVILDGRSLFTVFEGTLITYAALFLLISIRRPKRPTRTDLLVLKWGFPTLYFSGLVVYPCAWHLRGAL